MTAAQAGILFLVFVAGNISGLVLVALVGANQAGEAVEDHLEEVTEEKEDYEAKERISS